MFRQAPVVIAGLLCLAAGPLLADEAEDAFNSLYGNEYKKVAATPDKGDDIALAKQLLDAAKAPGVQPGLLSILCDKAYELGVKLPAGYEMAAEAMELLVQKVPAGAAAALDRVATIREKQYQAANSRCPSATGHAAGALRDRCPSGCAPIGAGLRARSGGSLCVALCLPSRPWWKCWNLACC
jgi:hypothetical protein